MNNKKSQQHCASCKCNRNRNRNTDRHRNRSTDPYDDLDDVLICILAICFAIPMLMVIGVIASAGA